MKQLDRIHPFYVVTKFQNSGDTITTQELLKNMSDIDLTVAFRSGLLKVTKLMNYDKKYSRDLLRVRVNMGR